MKITTKNKIILEKVISFPAHFQYIPDEEELDKSSFCVLAFNTTSGIVVKIDKHKKTRKISDFLTTWIPFTDTKSWKPIKKISTFED